MSSLASQPHNYSRPHRISSPLRSKAWFSSPLSSAPSWAPYLCGPTADRIANFYTRRNHGIREPEMRLPTCVLAAVLTFVGALLSSLCFQHKTHWAGPVIGWGILSAGGQMGATLGMNYSLDCHSELSVELMVTIESLKSPIAWIWTWVVNNWLSRDGPLVLFATAGAINVAVYGTTLVFSFKGKGIRIWLYERNLMGDSRS